MNMIKKILGITFMLFACIGCKNADMYQDVVFFTGTENTNTIRVSVEDDTSVGISISSSCEVESDVNIEVGAGSSSLVEDYNKKMATAYKLLPAECYELGSSNFCIEKGNFISSPVMVNICNIDKMEDEEIYLLPLTIVNTSSLSVLEASKTLYLVVSRPIITAAPQITSRRFEVPFSRDPNLSALSQLTLETRVKVNKFQSMNPYISTVMGIEGHFLLRFGDVAIEKDQIQVAGKGLETTAPTPFATDRWYHVAAVYDGSTVKIYINGKLDVSKAAAGGTINLGDSRQFYIGCSRGGRHLDGFISEARVWSRALTPKEIQNNMCTVDPSSNGLIAYWRFNEGEGNIIKDWTGHGWDLEVKTDLTWIEGVRCPE
jgi:hypothetical protein